MRKKSKSLLQKYKGVKTKGNISNSGLKTIVDLIIGTTLGAGVGATTGRAALPVGLLLIGSSHYMEEETGVLRVAGSAAIAYSIGKVIQNKEIASTVNGITLAGETTKAKTRLSQFKDEVLHAFYLDKVLKSKSSGESSEVSNGASEVGSIDLTPLDIFEQQVQEQALNYEMENDEPFELEDSYDEQDEFEDEFDDEIDGISFPMIEPDLTNI
ncbi:MAG: hypothetical protein COA32_16225 [Fluviicola sp.]|nr:MAG: hypothetical protein COA32_16225 [Fluviicola sp.]